MRRALPVLPVSASPPPSHCPLHPAAAPTCCTTLTHHPVTALPQPIGPPRQTTPSQDPFDLEHDLGRVVTAATAATLRTELLRAKKLLMAGRFGDCFTAAPPPPPKLPRASRPRRVGGKKEGDGGGAGRSVKRVAKVCAECGKEALGDADPDGTFYCDACWEAWEVGGEEGGGADEGAGEAVGEQAGLGHTPGAAAAAKPPPAVPPPTKPTKPTKPMIPTKPPRCAARRGCG